MPYKAVEALLEERIGLAADTVGPEIIRRAVRRRAVACAVSNIEDYLECLQCRPEEWEALIELVVVPETWFFRNPEAFDLLRRFIASEWLPEHENIELRVLSMPCSTGEEPFSIAITLKETGLADGRFRIDAVDISGRALAKARRGVYPAGAFRGTNLAFRDACFTAEEEGFRIHGRFRNGVRFFRGNPLEDCFLADEAPYDIIFCRNLLIYLSPRAKQRVVQVIRRLLAPSGLLFLGHAELRPFQREGYGWLPDTRAFACRRSAAETRTPTRIMDAVCGSPWIDGIPAATTPDSPAKGLFDMAEPPRVLHRPARKSEAVRLPEEMAPPGDLSPGSLEPKEGGLFEAARRKADRGELEDALALCRRFLDTRPADIPAHFLKGMIHQALGDDGEAERWLDRTIYLDPDHLAAMDLLGIIAEQRGDIDRADRLRRRADRIRHRREA